MTKGLAILCMVVLHLFCRKGDDVIGTPLLWLDSETPAVYIFGFLSEICVPIYSMCSGYAHYVIGENHHLTLLEGFRRIFRFLLNYWIIVILFSLIGIVIDTPDVPISCLKFIKAIFLLDTYNGAWWYVATYVLLCICSPLVYRLVKKSNWILVFFMASGQYGIMYICDRLELIPTIKNPAIDFLICQFDNFFGDVLLCYILGMLLVKLNVFGRIQNLVSVDRVSSSRMLTLKITVMLIISGGVFILEKGIIMPYYALFIFLIFNSTNIKGRWRKIFMFFGTHSMNIWLIHMFFYLCMFPGFVFTAKYPIFILAYMLAICLVFSYFINWIYNKVCIFIKI